MSCNLVVDIGNTCLKCAIMKDGAVVESWVVDSIKELPLEAICAKYSPRRSIMSVSGAGMEEVQEALLQHVGHTHIVSPESKFPITCGYIATSCVGFDRMVNAVGAWSERPNQNLLIIDSGTAVTIDFVSADGIYHGGFISPGFRLRFEALNNFTQALPLCSVPDAFTPTKVPNLTVDAVQQGVLASMVYEMEGHIATFSEKYDNLSTFFLGGDSFHFEKRIKNAIFAGRDLTFRGLDIILELNADK